MTYLLFVFLFFAIIITLPLWIVPDLVLFFVFAAIWIPTGLIPLLHAALATEYRITDDILHMKCGFMFKGAIRIDEIVSVEPVRFHKRLLGCGLGTKETRTSGFCNRFANGLIIRTARQTTYVSPSDNNEFLAELGFNGR